MTTPEKKSLFTAINEEESATVCGGFGLGLSLSITLDFSKIYSDPNTFLDDAVAYGIDINKLKNDIAAANSGDQQ